MQTWNTIFFNCEIMWREGYDYPSDDEEIEDDFMERADYDYERINDK